MQIEPELLALLTGVIGALLALAYTWLKGKFSNLPSLFEVLDAVGVIVVAARENHQLTDNQARLDWALERVQKYLNAKGVGKHFDARALVEYVVEFLKQREKSKAE